MTSRDRPPASAGPMTAAAGRPALAFLDGGGEAARMIRERDWTGHPLGAPATWPAELRAALSLILNSPESMILAWGPDLTFFFNDTYFPLLGPRLAWAMGERFDRVWADGWAQAKPIIDEAFAGRSRRFVDLPWRLDTDRGVQDTWWTFSYSRVLDAEGAIAGLFIFTNETTTRVLAERDREQAEAEVRAERDRARESEALAHRAIERVGLALSAGAIIGTWFWDLPTDRFAVDDAFATAFGLDPALGREGIPLAQIVATVHPDDQAGLAAAIAEVIARGGRYAHQYRVRRADGRYYWLEANGHVEHGPDGTPLRFPGVLLDVEARRALADERDRALVELRALNETLAQRVAERTHDRNQLWELSSDIMLRSTLEGVMTAVNPAWTEVLGWREDELVGRSLLDFVHPDDAAATVEAARQLSQGVGHARFDNRYRTRAGGYRWISWSTRPAEGIINAVGRDVTAEKEQADALARTEEALRQAQKMEAVGQLTGGLAHDFNNLLAGITGSLELMAARIAQGRVGEIDRYLAAAQGASRRAAALTHRLLAFSRQQTLAPKATEIDPLVRGMLELIQRTVGPGITLEHRGAGGSLAALVDAPQLENALLNLCINARDAMPDGGRIVIETGHHRVAAEAGAAGGLAEGEYVSLAVSDTGTGMTPDVVARAFDPFFTTKPLGQGTGLGLSMIYGFARQSGGGVRIRSRVGAGSVVTIDLPRYQGAADADEVPAGADEAPRAGAGETVLVVDDEPTVRMLVTDVLEELGYAAIEAADSPGGLRLLQSDARIDLLITDVGLPGGMNGRQMADAARATRPDLKVLFITGYAENALFREDQLGPGLAVLTKPFSVEALTVRVRALLAGEAARGEFG